MNVAIVGAAGACGRQLAAQLLDRRVLPANRRLQLVGHRGGSSSNELWGLRADLQDAFVDDAPAIELVFDATEIDADLVVMLAGMTIPTDPNASADRARLGRTNHEIFTTFADALARRPVPPIVIVQSNPVELGVKVFADRLGREHVLGAGAWSDTLRWRAELAADLGLRRPQVHAMMLGQHGDYLVPIWSQVHARDVAPTAVDALRDRSRTGRTLTQLPQEVAAAKAHMLEHVRAGRVQEVYAWIQALPSDLRAAVKPFFTHFTAGHTTEIVTAHAVADIVAALTAGEQKVLPAQVMLAGEWLDLTGVIGVPVILGVSGWSNVAPIDLNEDEATALAAALAATAAAIAPFE